MKQKMSRRVALQWMGGIAVGVVLSPAPYALIDDLTVATQTRGRSTALPTGPLGRVRTRCSACPRACSIDVLTVGRRPYLTVPAPGHDASCAMRPAVHQLALLPARIDGARLAEGGVKREIATERGLEIAAQWIDAGRVGQPPVGLVDLSMRPVRCTPLHTLATQLPASIWIDPAPHWLDDLGESVGLPPDLELASDPRFESSATRLRVAIGTGSAFAVMHEPDVDRVARQLHEQDSAGLLWEEDGAGMSPGPGLLARIAAIDLQLDAFGPGRLFPARPRLDHSLATTSRSLAQVEDGSLELLIVDASRAAGSVPWRRLRRKLRPTSGRLIAFGIAEGPAARHADLFLPAPAPLECEEIVGGSRHGCVTRLAISAPVHPRTSRAVDAIDLAQLVHPVASRPRDAEALAIELERMGRGTLCGVQGDESEVATLERGSIVDRLRAGAIWADTVSDWRPARDQHRDAPPRVEAAALRLCVEGSGSLASGESVPPVLAKIALEHRLLAGSGHARAHPEVLLRSRAKDGARCRLHTEAGVLEVRVHADPTIAPHQIIVGTGLGRRVFDPTSRMLETLESLDFDPRAERGPQVHSLEVLG